VRLQMYELLHPIHRLLDFWCGHPQEVSSFVPFIAWTDEDWATAKVHLHPQMNTHKFKEDLLSCIKECKSLNLSQYLTTTADVISIDSSMAVCLLPLLDMPQTMMALAKRWKQFRPIDPITLQSTDLEKAFELVKKTIVSLESLDYVMLERQH